MKVELFLSSTTGVGTVFDRRKSDGKTYNINGIQMEKPEKGGIYIMNGRKYVDK